MDNPVPDKFLDPWNKQIFLALIQINRLFNDQLPYACIRVSLFASGKAIDESPEESSSFVVRILRNDHVKVNTIKMNRLEFGEDGLRVALPRDDGVAELLGKESLRQEFSRSSFEIENIEFRHLRQCV